MYVSLKHMLLARCPNSSYADTCCMHICCLQSICMLFAEHTAC